MLPHSIGKWYKKNVVDKIRANDGWKFEDDFSQYDST